jgi:SPOR domain
MAKGCIRGAGKYREDLSRGFSLRRTGARLLPISLALPPSPPVSGGGYAVQVVSERSESGAQASFRALQAKYAGQLSGRQPIIRRADLGAAGIYYRALVGPFASAEKAAKLCSGLKAAGADCIIQKN